jgi:hypothetical protein
MTTATENTIGEDSGVNRDGDTSVANDTRDTDTADDTTDSGIVDTATEIARRRVSVSVRTLILAAVMLTLITAAATMTWLYLGARARLHEQARQADNYTQAEQVALDYAVNAAIIDFQNLAPWKQNLVKGTTAELRDKLSKAATQMDQILLPMQWSSTARPLVAKVRTDDNGMYIVDAFVSVSTKTVQAPDSLPSTATYSITLDSNHDWQITDVGGIDAMVGEK